MFLQVLLLFLLFHIYVAASSWSIINSLPGFPGDLPFKLETGYVGVGDDDDVQLFYYFIESERSPENDPLVLWLTGGPACSGFHTLVYVNIGPLSFDYAHSIGNKPKLKLNPYSWTKVANIIFIDAPVGTGFSYATTWKGYNISDTSHAAQTYQFLRKWLVDHPKFLNNPLYIGGASYSGIVVPVVVQEIADGNEKGVAPAMNLKGYVLGNPAIHSAHRYRNYVVPFSHLKALISDELYQSTKTNCKGEYIDVDPDNDSCLEDLDLVKECVKDINDVNILEPKCIDSSPTPNHLSNDSVKLLLPFSQLPRQWCRKDNYIFSDIWANDKAVQNALHIREGSIEEWARCNTSVQTSFIHDIASSLIYLENLIKQGYRVLVYSGDQDMNVPYMATTAWIESLNLTVASHWKPWLVNGQVAGYRVQYTHESYQLTHTTIKGGGHAAPEYKPEECLAMVSRWFAYYPL
ncbi:serine carboxypeptidase-like 7 isoform X1 [Pyrus x bretschneideri]|uniref:serine carboxypeptidase-like 7 isoform X1 n=1 Tax=Pyrus x bretschneideri TaxID=225117 RepID=UPI00202F650A|nr:serine carboxypeptidase-like 7 isoform X1 [Pyrus x bretschneideri]